MQGTQQTQQHNHLFATRIIKELEAEAQIKMKGKKLNMIDERNEYAAQKIIEYNCMKRWINEKNEVDQKRYLPILKRIKSEAIREMVLGREANRAQLIELGLTEENILFEIELRQLLSDWVELEIDESLPIRQGLRDAAIGGEELNYTMLNSLEEDLKSNTDSQKRLLDISLNRIQKREKYDKNGREIENPPVENRRQDISEELREIISHRIQIKREINIEKWRICEKKSEVSNLCYYILYDTTIYPNSIEVSCLYDPSTCRIIGFEDSNRVYYRIQHLSKHYLKILVGVICKINNEYYKEDIETNRKKLKKMNRQTNKISIQDKIELIHLGKSEGLSNKQISKLLGKGFGLRTVERYSK
jgi:hypothetical protein